MLDYHNKIIIEYEEEVGERRSGAKLAKKGHHREDDMDTKAVIEALKSGKIGYFGLDVYEEEADLFFEDLSNQIIQDDVLARLLTFPNVIMTGHQAFFTRNALENIAQTTLSNITDFEKGQPCVNEITAEIMMR